MLNIDYTDSLLIDLINANLDIYETKAQNYINKFNLEDDDLKLELIELRVYILVCIDNLEAEESVYSKKLEVYEKEFSRILELRKTKNNQNFGYGFINIPVER